VSTANPYFAAGAGAGGAASPAFGAAGGAPLLAGYAPSPRAPFSPAGAGAGAGGAAHGAAGVSAGMAALTATAAAAPPTTHRLSGFSAALAGKSDGDGASSAAYKRGASAIEAAGAEAHAANQAALMARIMRKWAGRKAADMSVEEAALVAQRGWKAFRARKLVKMWVKIVAFDGDVFYKNKVTGTLEWEIPALPPMTQAEKAKFDALARAGGGGAAGAGAGAAGAGAAGAGTLASVLPDLYTLSAVSARNSNASDRGGARLSASSMQ